MFDDPKSAPKKADPVMFDYPKAAPVMFDDPKAAPVMTMSKGLIS